MNFSHILLSINCIFAHFHKLYNQMGTFHKLLLLKNRKMAHIDYKYDIQNIQHKEIYIDDTFYPQYLLQ